MAKNKNPFEVFPNYVLRTPIFSFSKYKEFTSERVVSDWRYKNLCENQIFKEAIFIASPQFYKEMMRWYQGKIENEKEQEKIKLSILKYYSRMSSRCTPFGLFAGCSVGSFGEASKIELKNLNNHERHTRLDMSYLVALSQDLAKKEEIKSRLLFFPNTSMYPMGDKIRFIEYYYVNGKRKHDMVAVDNSEYLERVFKKAEEGSLLIDITKVLVDEDISLEDAQEFIDELVESQLLVSELEPSISGPEFLNQIISVLERIDFAKDVLDILLESDARIKDLDKRIGNKSDDYKEISEILKRLNTSFKLNYLFQTDLIVKTNNNTLDSKLMNNLKQALLVLNKITLVFPDNNLSKFGNAFRKKFETRKVPLSKALDVEIGVGYIQNQSNKDISPLVDDLKFFSPAKSKFYDIKWSPVHNIFQKKINKASDRIELTDQDLSELELIWDDLPDTLTSIVEFVDVDGDIKVRCSNIGGPTATIFLGRFCHSNQEIQDFTNKIVEVENKINDKDVFAEIIHLPKSRTGNVIMRPILRNYEIPYLTRSQLPKTNQLTIDDLSIFTNRKGNIALYSEKLKKEVIPRMANAHNFANDSLPIYHFLCDLQSQGLRPAVGIQLGRLARNYEFIPRIEYKNVILQDATWNLENKHIGTLLDYYDSDKFYDKVIEFQNNLKLPQFVMLTDNDNELIINIENVSSVKMLLDTVKNRPNFTLTEFLFSERGIIGDSNEYYTNQAIVAFYNRGKLGSYIN